MSAFVCVLLHGGDQRRACDLMRLWLRLRESPAFTKA